MSKLINVEISSQIITCGNGFIPYQRNGPARYMVCTNATKDVIFAPLLPKGLTFIEGVIKGSPIGYFDRLRIRVTSGEASGYFYISCKESKGISYVANDRLTSVDAGFDRQTIYTNIPFTPIRFYTDCEYTKFTIHPELKDGLSFDEDLGLINGIYTGNEQSVEYTITAVYKDQTASTVIVLDYKSRNSFFQMM